MDNAYLTDPFFRACLKEAAANKELVQVFDQLTGYNLSLKGLPIELEIDKATGRLDEGLKAFVEFVKDCIYDRIPHEKIL